MRPSINGTLREPGRLPELMIASKIELLLYTYNRARFLDQALRQFAESPFAECRFTVLDNCSTDTTPEVCAEYARRLPRFRTVRHPKNIGSCGNYLRAVELAEAPYTWIVCDDDTFDFTRCDDLLEALEEGEADLISVGTEGHGLTPGSRANIQAFAEREAYFRWHSSIPSWIFRTKLFDAACLAKGYDHADTLLPHFPFLAKLQALDKQIYVTRHTILHKGNNVGYSPLRFLKGWIVCCRGIDNPRFRRRALNEVLGWRTALSTVTFALLMEGQKHRDGFRRRFRRVLAEAVGYNPSLALRIALFLPLALAPGIVHRQLWKRYELYRDRQASVPPQYDAER